MAPELTFGECLNAQSARQELLAHALRRHDATQRFDDVRRRSSGPGGSRVLGDAVGRIGVLWATIRPGVRGLLARSNSETGHAR